MNNLILLGTILYIVLLIIVLCNIKNDNIKILLLLLNGVILPLLFYYVFPDNFIEKFDNPKSPKLKNLQKQLIGIINSKRDDKTIKDDIVKAIKNTKQSLTTPEEKQELEDIMESMKKKREPPHTIIEPENPKKNSIQLDKLSDKAKQALEKLYVSAKSKDVEKIFNLDHDTFATMLNEISK